MMEDAEIPAGWIVKRLKYAATYNDEVLSENTEDLKEIDYVEISGVSLAGGVEEINRIAFFDAPSRARRKVRSGDILISTVRTYLRAISFVAAASDDLIASTGFCVIRPKKGIDPRFLGWVVKSEPFVSEVVGLSVGVSYPAINASQLVTINIPVPPIKTQLKIVEFLESKTSHIDILLYKMTGRARANSTGDYDKSLCGLLSEYRAALITAAVTGRIEELI